MKKGLYFMPDISGFTEFVNNTEIEHSIHIISELLELLIDNNTIDLQLAEIEGDALFMYTENIPSYQELMTQVTKMLESFYKHTKSYENLRICSCGSCKTTTNLKLKFIVHYGELRFIKVKNIIKPYGREVIKIHRLLKNKVPINEYLLLTNEAFQLFENQLGRTWTIEFQSFDFGPLKYFYKSLENLIENKKTEFENEANTENLKINIPTLTIEKIFDVNRDIIFNYITELKYRHLWDKDVKRIDFDDTKVNREGTEHNCVLKLGNLKFITLPSKITENKLVYGEKTKSMMFTKNFSYFFTLKEVNKNKTKVELTLFVELNTLGVFMRSSIMKMLKKTWERKINKLHELSINSLNFNF